MDTAQTIIRAILDEQRRTGAQLHKAAQRSTRLVQEIQALQKQVDRQQKADATVQQRVADVFERLMFGMTGHSATADAAYVHDLFENWDARWTRLMEIAFNLRDRSGALAVCAKCRAAAEMTAIVEMPRPAGAPGMVYQPPDGWAEDHGSLFCPDCARGEVDG